MKIIGYIKKDKIIYSRWIRFIALIIFITIASNDVFAIENNFKIKGFHLDLRSQVMTIRALKSFAKELADFDINTLIVEWEATFPYENNATICNQYSYKPSEVKDFIFYCNGLGIDVFPIHHCFGHAEWILRHDRYRHISEDKKEVSQVCPSKINEVVPIFKSLFKEVADYHTSQYFHIGCDETYLLGSCNKCQEKIRNGGKSKLFVDYVKAMCEIVSELGKTPVLWADIILKYPEAIQEMPKNVIYVDWNYGWDTNHFGNVKNLYDINAVMWGAPSIRSSPDNMYLTTWLTHFNNQRDFIPYSRKFAYEGVIMTSWSTSGLYSFLYDQGWEIQDMEQVRNVYPLSGFRILLAAYAKSVNQVEPLDPKSFVVDYAQNRFGLTKNEGKVLWDVLSYQQDVIRRGINFNECFLTDLIKQTTVLRNNLYMLNPKTNKKEYEHLKLMFDIRVNYLKFKKVESIYQSEDYNRTMASGLISEMKDILKTEIKLDKRFSKLQKGFLTDDEIAHQNRIRKRKMIILNDFLSRQVY